MTEDFYIKTYNDDIIELKKITKMCLTKDLTTLIINKKTEPYLIFNILLNKLNEIFVDIEASFIIYNYFVKYVIIYDDIPLFWLDDISVVIFVKNSKIYFLGFARRRS